MLHILIDILQPPSDSEINITPLIIILVLTITDLFFSAAVSYFLHSSRNKYLKIERKYRKCFQTANKMDRIYLALIYTSIDKMSIISSLAGETHRTHCLQSLNSSSSIAWRSSPTQGPQQNASACERPRVIRSFSFNSQRRVLEFHFGNFGSFGKYELSLLIRTHDISVLPGHKWSRIVSLHTLCTSIPISRQYASSRVM